MSAPPRDPFVTTNSSSFVTHLQRVVEARAATNDAAKVIIWCQSLALALVMNASVPTREKHRDVTTNRVAALSLPRRKTDGRYRHSSADSAIETHRFSNTPHSFRDK